MLLLLVAAAVVCVAVAGNQLVLVLVMLSVSFADAWSVGGALLTVAALSGVTEVSLLLC